MHTSLARPVGETVERFAEVQRLFSLCPVGVQVIGPQGDRQFVNRSYLDLMGANSASYNLSDDEKLKGALQELLHAPDGTHVKIPGAVELLAYSVPADHEVGRSLVLMARDNSELEVALSLAKKLEQQFRQAQKMEVVGRFAGGIAHDFNNLLGVILLQVEGALEQMGAHPIGDALREIKSSSERAARLTKQILAFSRKQVFETQDVNLCQVVSEMEKMVRRLIGENIELVARLPSEPTFIRADYGQIEQAILNLAVNARDAMPEGGSVTISVERRQLDDAEIELKGLDLRPGSFLALAVADSGIGMEPEVLSRIFEPFFTTKEKGTGTGLGLSTVYGIVRQTGGDVFVQSTPRQGTCFTLYFPESSTHTFAPTPLKALASGASGAGKTVLLVEDERNLRVITCRILKKSGYEVLEASNGKEALEIFEKARNKIDLIITDVIMPEMTGTKLVQKLRQVKSNAEVDVLYLSGYSSSELDQQGLNPETSFFLEKPYSSGRLLELVGQIVHKKNG